MAKQTLSTHLVGLVIVLRVVLVDLLLLREVKVPVSSRAPQCDQSTVVAFQVSVRTSIDAQQPIRPKVLPPLLLIDDHDLRLWQVELPRSEEPEERRIVVPGGHKDTLVLELLLELVEGMLL